MRNIFLFLICSLTLLFHSCKSCQEEEIRYTDLQPLTLGIMPHFEYFPFAIALHNGIYADMGLELELTNYYTEGERDVALRSGYVDGILTESLPAIVNSLHGTPSRIVMSTERNYYLLTGRNSTISTLPELKGKSIAVRDITEDYIATKILEKAGITDYNEINKPVIVSKNILRDMLKNGQIDATIFADIFAIAPQENGDKSLISTREMNLPVTAAVFSDSALTDKRREIEVLIRGYNKAVKYMQSTPQEEWIKILIDAGDLSEKSAKYIPPQVYKQARLPDKNEMQSYLDWLKAKEYIPETDNYANLLDTIKGIKLN